MTFVRWLLQQGSSSNANKMPYKALYKAGPVIEAAIGIDGDFDFEVIAGAISAAFGENEDVESKMMAALLKAEATWRIDEFVDAAGPDEVEKLSLVPAVVKDIDMDVVTVTCGYRSSTGKTCRERALPGASRCEKHGGSITDPEVRRSLLMVAYAKVIEGSTVAVDALLEVAEYGRSEMARVQAAKELLDRAGVVQDQHVQIHAPHEGETEDDILRSLKTRLDTARDRLRLVAIPTEATIELPAATGTDDS